MTESEKGGRSRVLAPLKQKHSYFIKGKNCMIYLINTQDNHFKFWETEIRENKGKIILWRKWGMIGTSGQEMVEEYPTGTKAQDKLDELVQEKLAKGYEYYYGVIREVADIPFCDETEEHFLKRLKEIEKGENKSIFEGGSQKLKNEK